MLLLSKYHSGYCLGALFWLFVEAHVSRLFEPYYAGVRVEGYHLFCHLIWDVVVVLSEDKEVRNVAITQLLATALSLNHTAEDGNDSLVLGDKDKLANILDIVLPRYSTWATVWKYTCHQNMQKK